MTARSAALEVLVRVETAASHAAPLIESRGRALAPRDRNLLRALVKMVLRNRSRLDHVLSRYLSRPMDGLDPAVRAALRSGAAQLLLMDRIPAHAAVASTVEAARNLSPRAAGLVNAVLRRVASSEKPPGEVRYPAKADAAARLALDTSHPEWIVRRWFSLLGEEGAARAARSDQRDTPVDLLADPLQGSLAEITSALAGAGISCAGSELAPLVLSVESGNPFTHPLVSSGRLPAVDAAAQALAGLVSPARLVADLAAAPGGKTRTLLALGKTERVVACDRHMGRLLRLERNLEGAGRRAGALLVLADAARPPFRAPGLTSVLLDAPCSGTGTLRKNPEIRWRLKPGDLARFAAVQRALLAGAASAVAPGGRLVYTTCSLEPEENEEVVQAVADDCGLRVVPGEAYRGLFREVALERNGGVVLPPGDRNDGFTAFVLERRAPRSPSPRPGIIRAA